MDEYEHGGGGGERSGWRIVLLICAALLGWGAIQYAAVRDAPRRWDFGALPDAPSQSAFSASQPANPQAGPAQMAPLPEARPQPAGAGATPTGAAWKGAGPNAGAEPASRPLPGGGVEGGRP
jgi:hypothetical protein